MTTHARRNGLLGRAKHVGLVMVCGALVVGCSRGGAYADSRCVPGERVACTCPDGHASSRACRADGSELLACACDGDADARDGWSGAGHATGRSAVSASPDAGGGYVDGGPGADSGVASDRDAESVTDAWITVKKGSLPVVLSAPHGGSREHPEASTRSSGITVTDSATYRLALAVHDAVASELGRAGHLVAARLSREWVDFNREADEAYEDEALAPVYDAYHDALQRRIERARQQNAPCALLLDLHGQSSEPTYTFRGTRNGITASLTDLYTSGALLDALSKTGVGLQPDRVEGVENPLYRGGFIVATYGLPHEVHPINAVQLELGWDHRHAPQFEHTVAALASAIASHVRTQCPEMLE